VGAIVLEDAPAIVEVWCERVRAEEPTAARVHDDVLRNRLRDFLVSMGRGLLQSGERNPRAHRNTAIEHGEQRWDHGWSIVELVRDYQILHSVLLEHLSTALDRPADQRELMAIGVFIHDAIAASVAAYVANRDHEMRDTERAYVERLREAYHRKDDFLALVLHELRNPVAAIENAAAGLSQRLQFADDPTKETTRIIRRQTRHLTRIIDDLSDLTRITLGRLSLDRVIVDMSDIVEQAVQASAQLFRDRGHRLTVDLRDRSLTVDGDPTRLVQVVVNLLNNAAKYTPPNGEVSVTAFRQDGDVIVRVTDTGIGIDSAMIPCVFDMYARAAESSQQSPDGLGIGLALVQSLVRMHGGTVACRSDGPGRGSEFEVSIPAYEGRAPVARSTPEPRLAPDAGF
jgi:signal transduction histidine kinase